MKTIILITLALFFVSCAHKEHKKEIKQQVEQSTVKDPAALTMTIDDAIEKSPNLSAEEKKKMHEIIAANKQRAMALSEESFKLRGLLIEELLSGKMDRKKVNLLKKNIKKVEGDKLKNTFETVETISRMVSKNEDRADFADPLMGMERPLSR